MDEIAIHLSCGEADPASDALSGTSHRTYAVDPKPSAQCWTRADYFPRLTAGALDGLRTVEAAYPGNAKPSPAWIRARAAAARVGEPASGARALWLVLANAVAGKDAEFEDWYDNRHIHDSLAVPGFVSGQRFRAIVPPDQTPAWRYLTIYEIDLAAVDEALKEAGSRAGTAQMPNPGYLAPKPLTLVLRPLDRQAWDKR